MAVSEPAVMKGVSKYEGGRQRRRSTAPQMEPKSCAATYSMYLVLPNLQKHDFPIHIEIFCGSSVPIPADLAQTRLESIYAITARPIVFFNWS